MRYWALQQKKPVGARKEITEGDRNHLDKS
jgi:hypothetical protein